MKHAVAQQHYDTTGVCIYCEMLRKELLAQDRIVDEAAHFVAFHPFASRVPFETWILPRRHRSSFGNAEDVELRDLAVILH